MPPCFRESAFHTAARASAFSPCAILSTPLPFLASYAAVPIEFFFHDIISSASPLRRSSSRRLLLFSGFPSLSLSCHLHADSFPPAFSITYVIVIRCASILIDAVPLIVLPLIICIRRSTLLYAAFSLLI